MKTFLKIMPFVGIALMLFFAIGSLFAPDGMALVPPEGHEWLTNFGAIASNYINFWNVVGVVAGLIILLLQVSDTHIERSTKDSVKAFGVIKTGEMLRFKKVRFILFNIPYWAVLIASGWVATVVIWIALTTIERVDSHRKLQYFNEHYINLNGEKDEETFAAAKLSDDPLA